MIDIDVLAMTIEHASKWAPDTTWAGFVDFSRPADKHRFFLVNLDKAQIEYSWYTSHGSGSGGPEKATKFSNINMSRMSSRGAIKTGEIYTGKYGRSLKLHGLEKGINDNVESRAIVMHSSTYVAPYYMNTHKYPGRSWGCITLDPAKKDGIIDRLEGGSLLYINTND